MSYRTTFISSPASDAVFLLGIPVIALGGVLSLLHFNLITVAAFVGFTAIFTGAHHLPGFLRAYGTREIFDANRGRLIVAPVLIFSLLLFLEVKGLRGYIVVLWFFNWWHTAMQNYGLLRIYERKSLSPVSYSVKLDLLSIVVWHFTASELLSDDMRFTLAQHLYNLNVVEPAFVSTALWALRWVGIAASAVLLVLYIRNTISQFRENATVAINKQIFLFMTYGLYFGLFYYFMEDLSTSVESFYHNTQYVFFAWIMQRRLSEKAAGASASTFNWVGALFSIRDKKIAVFGYVALVGAYGYLIGGSIKPRIQTETIIPAFNVLVATLAFLHYYTDSFIWKARSREMSSVLGLKGAGLQLSRRTYGFSVAEVGAWILVPIALATFLSNPQNPAHRNVRENAALAAFSAEVLQDRAHWQKAAIASVDVGDYLSAGSDPKQSLAWYERAVAIRPDYADAYQALGHFYSFEGNIEKAAEAYEKAIALDGSFKASFNNLGNAYAGMGNYEKARKAYERAAALDPDFADAVLNLGNLQANQGEFKAAQASFERVLQLQPNSADALRGLGQISTKEGRFPEAEDYFKRLIQIDPNKSEGYLLLGQFYQSQNNLAEAEQQFKLAIAHDENSRDAHFLLASLYAVNKRPTEAIQHIDSIIAFKPSDPDGYIAKSQLLVMQGLLTEATAPLEEVLRLAPSNAGVHGNLGSIYSKLGRLDVALTHLQEAVRIDPTFADAYFELAQIFEKRRDLSIATMYLNQAARYGNSAAKQKLQDLLLANRRGS
jgi:tetratricopeptide (TPR) repeat protein